MNSLSDQFLETRMVQIGSFLNGFLKIKEIAKNNLVMTYFVSKAADQESQDKIVQLQAMIMNEVKKQKRDIQYNKGEGPESQKLNPDR